jgi:hypothetical protein
MAAGKLVHFRKALEGSKVELIRTCPTALRDLSRAVLALIVLSRQAQATSLRARCGIC